MTIRALVTWSLVAVSLLAPNIAQADAPLAFWPATGAAIHLHVTRVVQTADGPRPDTSDIVIRHKTDTTGTIERTLAVGVRDTTVVTFTSDGRIAIASDPNAAKRDPDLANLVDGLNFAASLIGGATASGQSGCSALLAQPPPANTIMPATAPPAIALPFRIVRSNGVDYDFDGRAQSTVTPASPQRTLGSDRRGGGGGFPGGGFPGGGGGGFPRRSREETSSSSERGGTNSPVTIETHVSGHATRGSVAHLEIQQSRTVSIEGLVYVNTSGWTFDAAH